MRGLRRDRSVAHSRLAVRQGMRELAEDEAAQEQQNDGPALEGKAMHGGNVAQQPLSANAADWRRMNSRQDAKHAKIL